jgi:hypothetical protein
LIYKCVKVRVNTVIAQVIYMYICREDSILVCYSSFVNEIIISSQLVENVVSRAPFGYVHDDPPRIRE